MGDLIGAALLAALGVVLLVDKPATHRLQPAAKPVLPTHLLARVRRNPHEAALAGQLPTALMFLAVCLDAGQPMIRALDTVVRVSPPATAGLLGELAAQLALGRTGPQVWGELRDHPVWGRAATDVARAERSGMSLTGALRIHAEDACLEERDAALKAARTVGVRSVIPLMVCFLPAFMLVGVVPIIAGLLGNFFG